MSKGDEAGSASLRDLDRSRRGPRKKDKDRAQHVAPIPVWVNHAGAWLDPEQWNPGILLEWRYDERGWSGLCAYAHGGGELPPSLQVAWVVASALRPIHICNG